MPEKDPARARTNYAVLPITLRVTKFGGELILKQDLSEKIKSDVSSWEYGQKLPESIEGFALKNILEEKDDKFEIFAYERTKERLGALAYFHEETKEYKLRAIVGLAEFVRTEFMAADLEHFGANLDKNLSALLTGLAAPASSPVHPLVAATGISEWEYGKNLPKNLEGFELFWPTSTPLPVANGSYMILNYADFARGNDFTIFYNIFRDEFFGESRIKNLPTVTYDFDANNLSQLEKNLDEKLSAHLKNLTKIRAA